MVEQCKFPTMILACNFTTSKVKWSEVEKHVCVAHLFCKKFQGLLITSPVTVHMPSRAPTIEVSDKNCAPRLQVALLDLVCYDVMFLYSDTSEEFWMQQAHKPQESPEYHLRHKKDEDVSPVKKASHMPRSKCYWTL